MNKIRNIVVLSVFLFALPKSGFSSAGDMFGTREALTLQGDFKPLSSEVNKFKWRATYQSRTRDDSPKGSRYTNSLLSGQVGYQVNDNAFFWVGYAHNWAIPLSKPSYQESRLHQDFVWNQKIGHFKLMGRTRIEERINLSTRNIGYRSRQLLQLNYSLPFLTNLSIYVGDEVLAYINQNQFGKQGFSENRILTGVTYQITGNLLVDVGYLGQYENKISGNTLFTHNLQTHLTYKF